MLRWGMAIALLALIALPASAETTAWRYLDETQIRVIDGDTIAYRGKSIRLLELQAPELHRVCAEEIALGQQAKAHLQALFAGAQAVRAGFAYRKNRAGQTVRSTDKYGRLLARLLIDRKDVGATMIEAGLARSWDGHGPKPSWCSPATPG